ncbi:hypothetical protein OROGR_012101 [Orobanche gracilis]
MAESNIGDVSKGFIGFRLIPDGSGGRESQIGRRLRLQAVRQQQPIIPVGCRRKTVKPLRRPGFSICRWGRSQIP